MRSGATLLSSLAVLWALAVHVPGQHVPVVPKPVTIDVTGPLTRPLQYRFTGSEPQAETRLEFKGNGEWRFIRFEQIPAQTALKINGKLDGYSDSEPLQPNKWYSFKNNLPVVLQIKPDATMPVDLAFSFGSPTLQIATDLLRNPSLKAEEVRRFPEQNEVKPDTPLQSLRFFWDGAGTNAASASASPPQPPIPTPPLSEPAETSLLTYLIDVDPLVGVFVLILILIVLGIIIVFGVPLTADVVQRLRRKPLSRLRQHSPSPVDSLSLDSSELTTQKRTTSKQTTDGSGARVPVDKAAKGFPGWPQEATGWPQESQPRLHQPGEIVFPPSPSILDSLLKGPPVSKLPSAPPTAAAQGSRVSRSTASPSQPQSSPLSQDFFQLTNEVAALAVELRHESQSATAARKQIQTELTQLKKQADDDLKQLIMIVTEEVSRVSDRFMVKWEAKSRQSGNGDLTQIEAKLEQKLAQAVAPVEQLMNEHASTVKRDMDKTDNRITRVTGEGEKVKRQLGEVLLELGQVERRLQSRLTDLQSILSDQAVPDSFYARTLGAVLGQNVEALQDGNFEKLMGVEVNRFFQSGVAGAEKLAEVRGRAEGISAALRAVVAQITKLNPQALFDTQPLVRRVEALVSELSELQHQLQTRRATIETTLRIPVSTQAGERQTFLDQLGHGIKHEIDKLKDPASYFEGELERLIGSDLIAIVDICDTKVAPPAARPELEVTLKQLFEQAGLRQILPRPGEPFVTAEQDLIEVVRKAGGQSMTVAQVLTRGFYDHHRDKETLLRKAGVTVYW
jgi:hypothetical protein